ncbi:MAG: patatin-like phospholipase family protein [Chlorobi bacterium]|nr:patatin-like phospholipase family protein [Chlorobiota bacterium]
MPFVILQLLLITTISYSQTKEIKNLVFEGAGIRGIAYAGAIQALEENGVSKNIEKVGGTSAGAISSLLFVLGYSSSEMDSIISETGFEDFNDGKYIFFGGISRTKNNYGWYRGEKFKEWIGVLIENKTGDTETTFRELHQKGYRDLYVTATCLNKQQLIFLSHETYPKMKVKDAVRISMSIPLYFQAVFVDNIGRTYSEQNENNDLDLMVDGGIIGNFPIQLFDTYEIDSTNEEIRIPNYETLGIRIDSDSQIGEDSLSRKLAPYPIEDFTDYISAFYIMVIENLNRNNLTEDDWNRTVSVSSVGITPKIKKLTTEQKEMLFRSVKESTENYFRK